MKVSALLILVIGAGFLGECQKKPPICEVNLGHDFILLYDHDHKLQEAQIQNTRQEMKAFLAGCKITNIGEPVFYPFPMPRLDYAIVAGDKDEVRSIISSRDDQRGYYSTRSDLQVTPVEFAAEYGTPEVVELLLNNGFAVNAHDKLGSTPLIWAVSSLDGTTANMDVLIKHGANINERTNNGSTALMVAVMDKNATIIEDLLSHGASMDTNNKYSLIELARRTKDADIVQIIENAQSKSTGINRN